MKRPIADRKAIIKAYLENEIDKKKAADLLTCSLKTVYEYTHNYLVYGDKGLLDHRHSNYYKLTNKQKQIVIDLKKQDRWRSSRNIVDHLNLSIHPKTICLLLNKEGLGRENIQRVKPIIRFEAESPNQMWQTDIMGKITFPKLGNMYLIATLDDYSRFVPAAHWFRTQGKINVFNVWYESLANFGLPNKMLQDEGSQYKARQKFGITDYQWYADQLKIKLIFAPRPQVKGKIERYWRFVQSDFVPSVWQEKQKYRLDTAFKQWLAFYNYKYKSPYFDNKTHAARYQPSQRRVKRVELETLLCIEERRKVTRESTISLYGKHYYVPPGYIGCHIWVKIKGRQILFEADGKVFWKKRLRIDD